MSSYSATLTVYGLRHRVYQLAQISKNTGGINGDSPCGRLTVVLLIPVIFPHAFAHGG
jgi:hypothetical protein